MKDCIIGYTGFIGGYLFREFDIEIGFNSSNISEIKNQSYDTVYCAAPSGLKWYANKYPKKDKENILSLLNAIKGVKANRFVLISSIDVYSQPEGQNESAAPNTEQTYGKNRLMIESFVQENFHDHTIVRCPIVFGPGFKKNVIFDLLEDNEISKIDPSRVLQFYDVRDLPDDLEFIKNKNLKLVNLATAPINIGEMASSIFGKDLSLYAKPDFMRYYMTTMYDSMFPCRLEQRYGFIQSSIQMMKKIEDFAEGYKE